MKIPVITVAKLMLRLRYALLLLLVLSACTSNRPVLVAIADLKAGVMRLDSSYRAFNLNYSRHVKAEIDSSVHRLDDDELRRELQRFTDPAKKY